MSIHIQLYARPCIHSSYLGTRQSNRPSKVSFSYNTHSSHKCVGLVNCSLKDFCCYSLERKDEKHQFITRKDTYLKIVFWISESTNIPHAVENPGICPQRIRGSPEAGHVVCRRGEKWPKRSSEVSSAPLVKGPRGRADAAHQCSTSKPDFWRLHGSGVILCALGVG